MSKLIVETEMDGIPNCCGLCDPLFAVVCATKHDQTIDKMMLRVGRPSWCPIKGELPDEHGDLIDRDAYLKLLESYIESKRGVCENKEFIVALQAISKQIKCVKAVIAAERKDDE